MYILYYYVVVMGRAIVSIVNKGKVWVTCKSLVVEMLKLNLPLSQESVCICMPSTS